MTKEQLWDRTEPTIFDLEPSPRPTYRIPPPRVPFGRKREPEPRRFWRPDLQG
jgi:hypothetical protein